MPRVPNKHYDLDVFEVPPLVFLSCFTVTSNEYMPFIPFHQMVWIN